MQTILGVDGGATKTHVIIMDTAGRVLGQGFGGPSNYNAVGLEASEANIGAAVDEARNASGIGAEPFAATFFGMASVVSPTDRSRIRQIAANLNLAAPDRVEVDHDCRIALAGGLSGRPGIVQIAGTGSSTFGMNSAGEGWRSGGWGALISDEGSSYWLGIQAMRTAVSAFDGRLPPTPLLDQVQQHLQLEHMNDIYQPLYVQRMSKAEVAQLARLVIDAARSGDRAALDLIERGVALMAECVEAVARRLEMADRPDLELALVGGLFKAGDLVVDPFRIAVNARLPQCKLVHAELSPVLGAGILALRLLDVEVSTGALAAFGQSD